MKNLDLMWLAGLLEGEGWFGTTNCHVKGKTYRYPRVGVSMTDRDVIERVAAFWGNKVAVLRPYGVSKKTQYRVMISGKKAAEYMVMLRPHMSKRRQEQIDAVLAEWNSREPTDVSRKKSCQEAAKTRTRTVDGRFTFE